MNRRAFVAGLGAVLVAPLGADAQPPAGKTSPVPHAKRRRGLSLNPKSSAEIIQFKLPAFPVLADIWLRSTL